jgi:transcriptional regulator with XRE-family HTH domain
MATTPAQAFGLALRKAREEHGLTQEEAAAAVGIDRAYYGHVERSTQTPTVNTVWRVSAAVGLKPSQLLARAERILAKGQSK